MRRPQSEPEGRCAPGNAVTAAIFFWLCRTPPPMATTGYVEAPEDAPALDPWRAARREAVQLAGGAECWEAPADVAARGGALAPDAATSPESCHVLLPYISRNMERWGARCGEACCFVDLCGTEKCSGCATLLHRPGQPPDAQPLRFACLDAQCADATGVGLLCAACVASPGFLHEHALLVRVAGAGAAHTTVRRTVGLAERAPLALAGVPRLACAVCTDEFGGECAPGFVPGCPARHTGVPGAQLVCCACVAQAANIRGGLLRPRDGSGGAAASVHCGECAQAAEAASFGALAEAACAAARKAFQEELSAPGPSSGCTELYLRAAWGSAARAVRGALSLDEAGEQQLARLWEVGYHSPQSRCLWEHFAEECARRWRRLHPQAHIQAVGVAAFSKQ